MQDLEQVIRERAYHLWEESGYAEGNAEAHWLRAQREILQASFSELGRVAIGSALVKATKAKASRKNKAA